MRQLVCAYLAVAPLQALQGLAIGFGEFAVLLWATGSSRWLVGCRFSRRCGIARSIGRSHSCTGVHLYRAGRERRRVEAADHRGASMRVSDLAGREAEYRRFAVRLRGDRLFGRADSPWGRTRASSRAAAQVWA